MNTCNVNDLQKQVTVQLTCILNRGLDHGGWGSWLPGKKIRTV